MTLSWRPPRSDGGAKIRGYIIQMKQRGQDEWDDVNGALIPTNVYTVPKLTEGEEYLFRVIAVNDVGNSDPSRPSNPIVIEEQPNKPVMDLGGVRDITVRAGEDFSIHVPYIGFPKPTATWYANDVIKDETEPRVHQQLGDDYARYLSITPLQIDRRNYESIDYEFSLVCSLVVKNAKRSDGGQYRLQLRNSSGFDTATINVKVLDRPNPPENLHADEFGGDALTLFWNPPKDNGGADITNYVVEKREPKGSWSKVLRVLQCWKLGTFRFAISFVHFFSLITTGEQLRDDTVLPSEKSNGRKYVRIPSNGRKSIWHLGSCDHDGSDQGQASVRPTWTTWNAKGRRNDGG